MTLHRTYGGLQTRKPQPLRTLLFAIDGDGTPIAHALVVSVVANIIVFRSSAVDERSENCTTISECNISAALIPPGDLFQAPLLFFSSSPQAWSTRSPLYIFVVIHPVTTVFTALLDDFTPKNDMSRIACFARFTSAHLAPIALVPHTFAQAPFRSMSGLSSWSRPQVATTTASTAQASTD